MNSESDDEEQRPIEEMVPIREAEKSTQSTDPNMTSTASFEYVAVEVYNRPDDSSQASDAKPALNRNRSDSIPSIVSNEENNEKEENLDEKENVPPIEDKENIPPPKHYSRIEGECVTPEKEKLVAEPEPLQSSLEESMLPIELQRGIDLLNVLIDSKDLDRDAKKKLTRKIVRRLMKASNMSEIVKLLRKHEDGVDQREMPGVSSASKSVASDHRTISGIATLSSSNSTASGDRARELSNGIIQQNVKQEELIHDWLKPATRSEIEKERRPKMSSQSMRKTIDCATVAPEAKPNANIREFMEIEKQNHFKWIDQEIEHLRNLKMLLTKKDPDQIQLGSSRSLPERNSALAYKNMQDKVNMARPATSATTSNSIKCKSSASVPRENRWTHQSASSANESDRPRTSNSTSDENQRSFPKWNSHLNLQQLVKNRTKLQTPSSDESIQLYAKARHAEFNRNYAKAQGILYGNTSRTANVVYEHPIYTKPYSSDAYSDCRNRGMRKILPMESNNNNAYASATGSAAFLSSNSVSIAMGANSTSNTTTHQYDTKISAGVQTSDTLQRMQPIYLLKTTPEPPKTVDRSTPTVRVRKFTQNKQQQARPAPLAYIITFTDKVVNRQAENDSETSNGDRFVPDDIDTDEHFTLQQYLRLRKPKFYSVAEERRKYINQMHYLRCVCFAAYYHGIVIHSFSIYRHERNQQKKKLLASYSTSSMLKMNMKRLLPPPPLGMNFFISGESVRVLIYLIFSSANEIILVERHHSKYEAEVSKVTGNPSKENR